MSAVDAVDGSQPPLGTGLMIVDFDEDGADEWLLDKLKQHGILP